MASEKKSILEGVGLQLDEAMSGILTLAARPAHEEPIRFQIRIVVDDLHRFMHVSEHRARAEGELTFAPLGSALPIRDGAFFLFRPEVSSADYQLVYRLGIDAADGSGRYTLLGEKTVRDDPGFDILDDMTRMKVRLFRGEPETGTELARGEMRFALKDLPSLVASMKVLHTASLAAQIAARVAFLSFAYGTLRGEYLKKLPTYDTQCENLVLQGTVVREGGSDEERPFFLVTGVHDRGFPWGDGEIFWDVLLLLGDGSGGWRRFAMTDRILPGMEVDVAQGIGRYAGRIFELAAGAPSASFSQMRKGAAHLTPRELDLRLQFAAKELTVVAFPFREISAHLPSWTTTIVDAVHELLPAANPLGIWITPHWVDGVSGTFTVAGETWNVVGATTAGEAERSTFRNVREPTLLYHYLCALDREQHLNRVQIDARTLRNEKIDYAKDQLDRLVGSLVGRMASAEIEANGQGRLVRPLRGCVPDSSDVAERMVKLETLVEVDNDHFPTAVFERNVVRVSDREGNVHLALEEEMRTLRIEAAGPTKPKARVVAIRDDDKLRALDAALAQSGFDATLDAALVASGKARSDFLIALKPSFMFAYSKHDPSTFTDPELVAHLARHLVDRGFSRLKVVEAQSSYGEYFTKRSVAEMAEYLGFSGKDAKGPLYEAVDLTLDASDERELGPKLGKHPVPRTWSQADFRISFAKNKTHAYAYYTLAIKNVYGALPLAAKFREYHCKRDIYETTLEYLAAFPVCFALIDAYLSADGPFGVFADPLPNPTHTVLAGPDLVAVDWVGATKMGIDPMLSRHMQLAVERLGKPEIDFVGDESAYRPWLNVPPVLTWFTNHVLDSSFERGSLFYAVMANMDEQHFAFKNSTWFIDGARTLSKPLRDAFFVQTGQRPSLANRAAAWLQEKLGN